MADTFVRTKGSSMRGSEVEDSLQVVKYNAPKPKARRSDTQDLPSQTPQLSGPRDTRRGIDIKRARREIIKFGISGMSSEEQRDAKVALAISLGARPPKNETKNYVELKENVKRDKLKAKKMAEFQQAGKNAVGASTAKKKFNFGKADSSATSQSGKVKKARDLLDSYGKATIPIIKSKVGPAIKKHRPKKKPGPTEE